MPRHGPRLRSSSALKSELNASARAFYFLGAAMTLILPWNESLHQTRYGHTASPGQACRQAVGLAGGPLGFPLHHEQHGATPRLREEAPGSGRGCIGPPPRPTWGRTSSFAIYQKLLKSELWSTC